MIPSVNPIRTKLAAILAGVLLLGACAETPPPALTQTGGRALVLGPERGFNPAQLADPWWRSPSRGDTVFQTVDLDSVTVLRVNAPAPSQPSTTVIGRRLAIPLLASPFLQWAWYLEPALYAGGAGDGLDRGLRITVGFYGGAPSSPQLTDRLFGGPAGYPAFDRQLEISFGGRGTPRGDDATTQMLATSAEGVRSVLRAPQAGQTGDWKLEALDLSKLYQAFWPRDRIDRARIAFVAVGGLSGRPTAQAAAAPLGYVAEISLSR